MNGSRAAACVNPHIHFRIAALTAGCRLNSIEFNISFLLQITSAGAPTDVCMGAIKERML